MNTAFFRNVFVATLACGLFSVAAEAQWSSNSASNLTLADHTNEQVQPKIRAASDGGCFVSWYDNATGGYDVYLQRLDKSGVEQWAHNGTLIADRSVSSTTDYGLAVDSGDNAIIAFADDRFGSSVTVQKVNSAGTLLWNGNQGVQLTPASTFASPPSVAVLSDGNYAVIWNDTTSPIGTWIQKLDTNGVPQFAGSGILQDDALVPQQPLQASDVQAADSGSFIVLFVRCTGSNCILSNKQLYIQKYDSTGAALWNGGAPLPVMGATSTLQTANFPRFLPDGNGGAVLGWYEITTGARNAYIQHVLANGTLKFASPVSNVGPTNPAGRIRIGAGLAYNPASGEYFLASPETDAAVQSMNSVFVQRFDSSGMRLWGDSGVTLLAITTSTQPSFVQSLTMGDGAAVFWEQTTSATTRVIAGARVLADQTVLWNELPASDGSTDKSRLDSALSTCGFAMLAFGNGASGSVDIQAQNVLSSGALGNPAAAGDMDCDGAVTVSDIDGFTQALLDPLGYIAQHPCCNIRNADANHDTRVDGLDISTLISVIQ